MAQQRPLNILHLFADQQRFDTIGALGNTLIRTPNLDRLANEGLAFTRAYSPSPECVPARASMITGHYPGRTGCYGNRHTMPSNEEQPSFMERLKQAGYHTHGVGKCHFNPDRFALRGFCARETQEEIPQRREDDDYASGLLEHGYDWLLEPHGIRGEMYYIPQPSVLPPHEHPTHWIGDRTAAYIRDNANSSEPWYLYGSFIHPHPPFAPPVPWHKLYRAPDMPLPMIPEDRDDLIVYINRYQNRAKYRDNGGIDLNLVRCQRAYYYACISFIDMQVGRILQALEETGQLANTLILYGADHGEYLGDYGCFGKRGMHDVSARVPLLVRWPDGYRAGERCDTPASLVDFAPTFVQAAGLDTSEGEYDGLPLRDLASGKVHRERVYSQLDCADMGLYMAVEHDWKFVYSAPDQKEYLFDLKNDPRETANLATRNPDHPQLQRLRGECQAWIRGTGQTEEVSADGQWKPYEPKRMPNDPDQGLIFQDPPWWDGKPPV
ncbi:sulfatase-like hydrolase/transferase [Ruficoccus sp. ZRK36]|uniref:sulfatase family protein n=1 Tax=Ruficoccus sp. ZRK36 TaxID=2866311 RepID=UPI001C733C79|nr:sulfatase-like hydrolase/transferase [Ruficoccus sp. ZRK36]QYY35807.1 sulfatase-like hydrolase/transferase [Ruficoccus sp. ZRK36]